MGKPLHWGGRPNCNACDELLCDDCAAEAHRYWSAYFGLRDDMTKAERLKQLEAVRPLGADVGVARDE